MPSVKRSRDSRVGFNVADEPLSRRTPRLDVPPVSAFVTYPSSWYVFGFASELGDGPVSRRILGQELAAYRTEDGRVVVLDARCSHLGADLGRGRVVGECIQCPFHGWRYGPDGRCRGTSHAAAATSRFSQRVYPVVERHGMIFFFNGAEPLFPLPFFFGERPEAFMRGTPVEFAAGCTWFMVAAHGYDTQHFETVHGRRLHGPLDVDCPSPFARRSRYRADVIGEAYYDRLLRRFAGRTVDISITTWGGTLVFITGTFPRAVSRFMIALEPLEDATTRCQVIVFTQQLRNRVARRILQPVGLRVRRLLTEAYLIAEAKDLGTPRYNPDGLVEADRTMVEYFHWAAALPPSSFDSDDTVP
jgi:aminopyrrolnitrin oxygenase